MSEKFKQYKRKLRWKGAIRKHSSEDWDTGEAWQWISNDEGLYEAVHDAVRMGWPLREVFESYGVPNVDPDAVDWDEIAADITGEQEDEMEYDAQEMLNPQPSYQETKGDLQPDQSPWQWQAGDVLQDRGGAQARVEVPMSDPDSYLQMTHIAPGQQHHGQSFSLHPRALIDTYGYQRVPEPEQSPQDFAHPDPWMDNEPGTMTFPTSWT